MDVGLILALFAVKSGILTIFIYSYYGAYTTNNCLAFGDILYDSQWYNRLSLRLRKCLINIIFDAQRPLIFSGFGIVQLTLETFLAVWLLIFIFSTHVREVTLSAEVTGKKSSTKFSSLFIFPTFSRWWRQFALIISCARRSSNRLHKTQSHQRQQRNH